MKKFYFLILLIFLAIYADAQNYPLVTIRDIQEVSNPDCDNEESDLLDDTVRVRGVVVVDGDQARGQGADSRNVWIQDGTGPWTGLDVFGFTDPTQPTDIKNLVAGDSVEITGVVLEYQGESEIAPLVELNGQPFNCVTILGTSDVHVNQGISIGDLNDDSRNNKIPSGEQYEGLYAEFTNLTVASVDFFSGGSRVSFNVTDVNGNTMNVSDRFLVQKLPQEGGNFTAPPVGTKIDTLRGIIVHSKNNCPGSNGRGFELFPFQESDYIYGAAPPFITDIALNPEIPTSSDDIVVTANVVDLDEGVKEVTLYYAVGVTNENYTSAAMTNTTGDIYEATIPAKSDGSFIKYYVEAEDNSGLMNTIPNVPNNADPYFVTVRNDGLSIYDVQYTPFSNGNSGFLQKQVTVSGIVTASAASDDLGFVFIQQPGQSTWAGVMLTGTGLTTLKRGDEVEVTGEVNENFGFTRIEEVSNINVTGSGTIDPVKLPDTLFTSYNFNINEPYEGMLVSIVPSNSDDKLYIVDENADGDDEDDNNFAEYRIGSDTLDPERGTRVLAGRVTGSAYSSLNFSYVNDSAWEVQSGAMNVDLKVVRYGESLDSMHGMMVYTFGNFKLLPRNNEDMVNYSDPIDTGDGTDGLREIANLDLRMYPNPTEGELYILPKTERNYRMNVEILDLQGKVIQNQFINTNSINTINLNQVKSGMYLIKLVNTENGKFTTRKVLVN